MKHCFQSFGRKVAEEFGRQNEADPSLTKVKTELTEDEIIKSAVKCFTLYVRSKNE
jgi:hypothetical protein